MRFGRNIALGLIFYFGCINAASHRQPRPDTGTESEKKIAIFSMPKSGTHLLIKAIDLICIEIGERNGRKNRTACHEVQDVDQNAIKFIIIRDPRDRLASQITYFEYARKNTAN